MSLRTVEHAVAHLRREVLAQTAATVHFKKPPGHLVGIVGAHLVGVSWLARSNGAAASPQVAPAELLWPLAEYETALGGGVW